MTDMQSRMRPVASAATSGIVSPAASGAASLLYAGATDDLLRHNGEVAWDSFASQAYWAHNYSSLRTDDQEIINRVAAFFSQRLDGSQRAGQLRGLDVGSGANLYPALSMLPWCSMITLTDVSPANCAWLRSAAAGGSQAQDVHHGWVWQPFWQEYAKHAGYGGVFDPRAELAKRHEVTQASVMDLPSAGWDLGTMFFVAESMTSYETEFEDATAKFLRALVPGAPFAAAFMDSSVGYVVADQSFPAVQAVDGPAVTRVLSRFSDDAQVQEIEVPALDPLRDGYKGMIIATGTTRAL